MANDQRTITLQDISGALPFLKFRGVNQIVFRKEPNGRVVAEVPATMEVYQLLAEFQGNPLVPLTEFLACQRRLRGQMLELRDGGERSYDVPAKPKRRVVERIMK
jgi:hypothetical protein